MFKLKRFAALGIILCIAVLAACAAPGASLRVESGSVGPELTLDPNIVRGELANGFTYYLLKNSTPENRVSMHLNVQTGSMGETEAERGVAHYLEHMLFNGSTHFKPDDLVEYFQSIGMGFGADVNAHTGFYETVYDILLPKGDRDSIDGGLLVLDDFARGALLLESEVDRERGVILAEKRERDSVAHRTFEQTLAFELPGARLPRRLPIGTEQVIKAADQSLLKGFYDAWYRPENMMLVAVGDFDVNMLETQIKQRFSDMTARAPKRVVPGDAWEEISRDRAFYLHEPEAGNTTITIEKVRAVPFEEDTLDAFKKRSVLDLAEAVVGNRLSRLVRQKDSPLSDAGIYSGDFFQGVHFAAIAAECDPGAWRKSLELVETTLRQALEFGFSDGECARVKADYIQGLTTEVKEAPTRKSGDLARKIIYQVNRKRIFQSPDQQYDILVEFLDSLTPDQLVQALRDEWEMGSWHVLVTGNAVIDPSDSTEAWEEVLKAFKTSRAKKVFSPVTHEHVEFPYLPSPRVGGKIKTAQTIQDLDVKVVEFENQITLNLKQTSFKRGEFVFTLAFGKGKKAEPKSLPGIASLAVNVLNESGFGGIDRDQIEAALAGKNVKINLSADEGRFLITGFAGSEESELVFQMIRNYFLDPGFRQSALDLVQERYRQFFHELQGTPEGAMALDGESFLAGGDSRFGFPSILQIQAITLADIKSFMDPYFTRGGIELSIVGDFNPEQLLSQAQNYLGSLPERKDLESLSEPAGPTFPAGKILELTVETTLDKALVQLAFPTDDFWDISRVRRLNVLASIFSDRLRKNIREKLGASYSPFAYNDPSRFYDGYGVFRAVVNVEPDAAEMVVQEIESIAVSLAENGVTEKEVTLACKPIVTHIRDMQKSNAYWLESVLSGSKEHPEKFEWATTILDEYSSIGVDGINRLAQEYLTIDKRALIVIRPLGGR
ncbi:MAG: insulinase family protein [Desulfobacterium sp.]|jgi:zinc protease|nr:insulinase family protein [Desulfobacterium sp.]